MAQKELLDQESRLLLILDTFGLCPINRTVNVDGNESRVNRFDEHNIDMIVEGLIRDGKSLTEARDNLLQLEVLWTEHFFARTRGRDVKERVRKALASVSNHKSMITGTRASSYGSGEGSREISEESTVGGSGIRRDEDHIEPAGFTPAVASSSGTDDQEDPEMRDIISRLERTLQENMADADGDVIADMGEAYEENMKIFRDTTLDPSVRDEALGNAIDIVEGVPNTNPEDLSAILAPSGTVKENLRDFLNSERIKHRLVYIHSSVADCNTNIHRIKELFKKHSGFNGTINVLPILLPTYVHQEWNHAVEPEEFLKSSESRKQRDEFIMTGRVTGAHKNGILFKLDVSMVVFPESWEKHKNMPPSVPEDLGIGSSDTSAPPKRKNKQVVREYISALEQADEVINTTIVKAQYTMVPLRAGSVHTNSVILYDQMESHDPDKIEFVDEIVLDGSRHGYNHETDGESKTFLRSYRIDDKWFGASCIGDKTLVLVGKRAAFSHLNKPNQLEVSKSF